MKKALFGVAVLALGLLTAPAAHAAIFTVNFCPGDATCPDGITEASLTFEDIADGDPNNYTLTIKISDDGTSSFDFVDSVQFTIDGVETPGGYEANPSLTSSPATTGTWNVYFDNIDNSFPNCSSNTNIAQGVCIGSDPVGSNAGAPLTGGDNIWVLTVDLAGTDALGLGSSVNLRAHFLQGPCETVVPDHGPNAGQDVLDCAGQTILSPGGGTVDTTGPSDTTGPGETTGPGNVPEPALLSLLGVGLVGAASRLRKKA